jgi:hypothetical protein
MKPKSQKVIAVINALQKGMPTEEIAETVGVSKSRIYNIRHKLKQQAKEKVRAYVRKTPHHPKKLQKVGPYIRGGKTKKDVKAKPISGEQMNAFTQFDPKAKFVPPRSFDVAELLVKNRDLYNEIKDQQAIIRYLEGLVTRISKSN